MHARWLAPLALSLLSPALAHADPPAAPASAAAAPPAAAVKAVTPAPEAPAAKATAATPAAKKSAPAAAKRAAPAAASAPGPRDERAARAPRPRRAIERREQAKKAGRSDLDAGDMEVSARPQQPLIEFVVEKAPATFELPELHPGQYSVPTGLTR
ncbi:MAG: hypothetical protein EOO75_07415 [Myxococcales bacterium]|nr:MAG: hypothetical protein EOO75_07415 [Myxococcales bacterium]